MFVLAYSDDGKYHIPRGVNNLTVSSLLFTFEVLCCSIVIVQYRHLGPNHQFTLYGTNRYSFSSKIRAQVMHQDCILFAIRLNVRAS